MCAASPARKSRPCCIGSVTKLRKATIDFCSRRPVFGFQPSFVSSRVCNSAQMRSSDHWATSSCGSH